MSDQPLTSLRVMDSGRIAAVGSADGTTTIVQFSDGLVDLQPNEKQALTSVSCCCTLKKKATKKVTSFSQPTSLIARGGASAQLPSVILFLSNCTVFRCTVHTD